MSLPRRVHPHGRSRPPPHDDAKFYHLLIYLFALFFWRLRKCFLLLVSDKGASKLKSRASKQAAASRRRRRRRRGPCCCFFFFFFFFLFLLPWLGTTTTTPYTRSETSHFSFHQEEPNICLPIERVSALPSPCSSPEEVQLHAQFHVFGRLARKFSHDCHYGSGDLSVLHCRTYDREGRLAAAFPVCARGKG